MYYELEEDRYDQDEVSKDDLDYELVVYKGELLDGYSRASQLLRSGVLYTKAYVLK